MSFRENRECLSPRLNPTHLKQNLNNPLRALLSPSLQLATQLRACLAEMTAEADLLLLGGRGGTLGSGLEGVEVRRREGCHKSKR